MRTTLAFVWPFVAAFLIQDTTRAAETFEALAEGTIAKQCDPIRNTKCV